MKGLLTKEVPAYAVIILLTLVMAAAFAVIAAVRNVEYSYNLTVPAGNVIQSFTYGSWPALDNTDFYGKVVSDFIAQKATFISVDLTAMQLQYYEDGALAEQFPVLSKGRPGSWWETPAGLYKVEEKIPKDFSGFAHVYSPWALDFQGNFLIHGWPYYPDGTPVGSTYSGGCIRLSTDNAKTLYDMVAVGTPVLVTSADFQADSFHEKNQGPPVDANSYLAADLKSNFVLASKNPDEQLPIASLTKLMTALVAVEYINIEKTITITPDMLATTSIPRLKAGSTYSLYDLLQPLLKESSNEAAAAISDFLGPKYFVSLMNRTAQSIGMTNTRFVDTSGSDWGDVSTARDLFTLAQYLYNNRSFILKMTTNRADTATYGPSAFPTLQNFNVFADDPDFIGGKVGVNGAASDTILSVFNGEFAAGTEASASAAFVPAGAGSGIPASSGTAAAAAPATVQRPFMFVILGSQNYDQDAGNMLAWIKAAYD